MIHYSVLSVFFLNFYTKIDFWKTLQQNPRILTGFCVVMDCRNQWILEKSIRHLFPSVSNQRNHIPRKSLNYRTPIEIFLSYVQEAFYFSLIWQIIWYNRFYININNWRNIMFKNIKAIISGIGALLIAEWLYHVLSQDPNINIWVARLLPIPDNFSSLLFDWLVNLKNDKVTLAIWFINTAEPLATSGHHGIGRQQYNGYLLSERHTCFMVQQIVLPIKDSNVLRWFKIPY